MSKFKESITKLFAYKRLMITTLVVVALLLTSSTFSYWAITVQGESSQSTMSFRIGEYYRVLYDFVLNEENITYTHEADIEYLLEDKRNNKDEVMFGVVWNDPSLYDEFKDQNIEQYINVEIELAYYQNGVPVDASTKRALDKLAKLVENNNIKSITYGEAPEQFEFLVKLNKNRTIADLSTLLEYEVVVEINLTMNYYKALEYSYDNIFDSTEITSDGDDIINVSSSISNDAILNTGAGDDEVTVGFQIRDEAVVDTGAGNDTVLIESSIIENAILNTGSGSDSVLIKNSLLHNSQLLTGIGDDNVEINEQIRDYATVDTGAGNDSLILSKSLTMYGSIFTGDDNDSVYIGISMWHNSMVDTGSGDDIVTVESQIKDNAILLTGTGNDIVTVGQTVVANANIQTGSGNDSVYIESIWYNFSNVIDTGEGNDTVTINVMRPFDGMINGNAGDDTLVLENYTISQWNSWISSQVTGFETIVLQDGIVNP